MEDQNKKYNQQNDGRRISVRPGNFTPPAAPAVEQPTENRPRQDRPTEGGDNRGGNRGHNRRNRGRDNRGHNRPENNQERKSPSPEAGEDRRPAAETSQKSKKSDGRGRNNQRRRPAAPEKNESRRKDEPRREAAPALSDKLQRELDADFDSPLSAFSSKQEKSISRVVDTEEFAVDIATAAYLVEDIPCGFPAPDGKSVEVIGVRFRRAGKIYFFSPNGERFKISESVIVDTARGPELGEVVMLNRHIAEKDIIQPLRQVLRRASAEDVAHDAENRRREIDALRVCAEKVAFHKLDMKLVEAQYAFDNSKLLFYFTSEGRVDFRELVRDLAGVFRTRIELRQIGIRDESRLIGGLGMCGRPFCCTTFLSDFGQVSVKMAKEQGLSINTSKISGCCGRLMCCLRYEHETYAAEAALTPTKDTRVETPDGIGTVTEAIPLAGTVKVRLDKAPEEAPTTYHRDSVTVLERTAKSEKAASPDEEEATPVEEN